MGFTQKIQNKLEFKRVYVCIYLFVLMCIEKEFVFLKNAADSPLKYVQTLEI